MISKKYLCFVIACFFLCASCIFNPPSENSLQIKGSDTMVNLVQAWAEDFMQRDKDIFIAVTGGGSGTGIASLINGTCDIAMSSRNIKAKEVSLAQKRDINPLEIIAALDGLAVVVNPKNPVDRLTIDEIAQIFSGKITNWKNVGGEDRRIVVLSREVNSGTHVYFKEHILCKNNKNIHEEFAPTALLLSSSQAVADEVAANTDAIGYYGMGYISPRQKTVAIAQDENSSYINPEVQNVMNQTYPISRPLYIYTNGEPVGALKKFLDFTRSAEGQKIVLMMDFVPLQK